MTAAAAEDEDSFDLTVATKETFLKVRQMKARIENTLGRRFHELNARRKRQIIMEKCIQDRNLQGDDARIARRAYNQHETSRLRASRIAPRVSSFECVTIIGKGAFGEVRIVKLRDNDDQVFAMKSMRKRDMIAKNQASHVLAERNLMVLSESPYLVKLFYSFQDAIYLYLVMEFCGGGDLMTILMREDILTEDACKFYMSELASAIHAVHELSFVHRDLKPDNILISNSGHIKLSDFGLAKSFDSRNDALIHRFAEVKHTVRTDDEEDEKNWTHRRMHSTVGTPDYIAPEVFSNKGYDISVDWWSLGVIMFECLVGYPPFYAEDPLQTCKKIVHYKRYFRIPKDAHLSENAQNVIHSLVCSHRRRIGFDEIAATPFFSDLPWHDLLEMEPPFRPDMASKTDASNFDTIEAEQQIDTTEDYSRDEFPMERRRTMATDSSHFWNYAFKRNTYREQVMDPRDFFDTFLGPVE